MHRWVSRSLLRMSPAPPERFGTGRVALATPDGYVLCVGFLGTHVLNGAIYGLQYDVVKDFEPIALLASNPQLIVAKKATPAQGPERIHRVAEGKSGKGHTRIGRHRQSSACQRRILSERKWYDISIRAVPRGGPGHAGPGGRTCRPDVRSATELPAACACRQHQGLRCHRQGASRLRAGHPHSGRSRFAGILHFCVVWHVGSEGHAAGGHLQAQRGHRDTGRLTPRGSPG